MPSTPLIIGHRGASRDAPENTLASFRLAFTQQADGIEADFRLTRDGHIVCLHDPGTSRTTGMDLAVADATLAQLQRLDAGSRKGERWRGEPIPTLAQVLGMLPAGKRLFVELKCGTEIIAPLAADLARAAVPADRIRFLAFDHLLVAALKERLPDYRVCWLCDYRWRGGWHPSPAQVLARLAETGADGLASRDRAILDAALVRELRQRGLEIHVWTVDSARGAARLADLGVDSIMTNRPGWLRRALGLPGEKA
ncbi:glycerophosphodiester phosphodiesterase [Geomonas paludis]|uniref:Glycerophosphoryl diester phosphodiesterase n=1 Tax=Geomonas paludis TaxID=2740185 RepID=A0A6V8MX02_9BACT|nr:glycerophosphodiester phosphodiesterase [Geomonas paludis]GFO64632.1 glycerophosphoryl diester phosphodiesterase [Geomonas paludis]